MRGPDEDHSPLPYSKRAARRLIQRALVLVGREKSVRQHIREARVTTLWVVEDWKLAWTVEVDRGRVHFDRRPARRPDISFTWRSAEGFFRQVETDVPSESDFELSGPTEARRFSEPVYRAFCKAFRTVLHYPFDDEGNRLA